MVVTRVIEEAHEGEIVSIAYNSARREIYSAADGDKVIKVSNYCSSFCLGMDWPQGWLPCI